MIIETKHDINDKVWFLNGLNIHAGIITDIRYHKYVCLGDIMTILVYRISYEGTTIDKNENEIFSSEDEIRNKFKKPTFWDYVRQLEDGSDEWRVAIDTGTKYFNMNKNPDDYLDDIKFEVERICKGVKN